MKSFVEHMQFLKESSNDDAEFTEAQEKMLKVAGLTFRKHLNAFTMEFFYNGKIYKILTITPNSEDSVNVKLYQGSKIAEDNVDPFFDMEESPIDGEKLKELVKHIEKYVKDDGEFRDKFGKLTA